MSFEYQIYRQEILDFLSTVTIKFDPFTKFYIRQYSDKYGLSIESDYDNPYYLNMCGLYSKFDTPMYVNTIEDNTSVLFDINLKTTYPMTAALYKVPSEEYKVLCAKYPQQTNLIKSIVYPVKDLQTAIESPILTLMAYDANLLYPTERESIITALNKFIEYVAQRWYVPDFDYEDLFPSAFWSILISLLPMVCYHQRLKNLRTVHVHPMHVWEYLQSKGFKDYRSILTHKQSLFLYRNLMYLYRNKGKTSNLEILAENLLDELYVTLVGKNLYLDTAAKADDCITVPEVISEDVKTRGDLYSEDFSTFENIETMVRRMYMAKLEVDDSVRHIRNTENTLGTSKMNYLPSKFLEFKKYMIDSRFLNLMLRFLFQTFCYKWSNNRLVYKFKYVHSETNTKLDLTLGEVIALINYAHHKSLKQDPVTIPTEIIFNDAYKEIKPDIPFYFNFMREPGKYPFKSIVAIDEMIQEIGWSQQSYNSKLEFNDFVIEQFKVLVKHISAVGASADLLYHDTMEYLYTYKFLAKETKSVNLVNYTTYQEWFDTSEELTQLTSILNNDYTAHERYAILLYELLKEILPLEDDRLKKFFGASRDDTEYYRAMKELFTNMNSYNVTFLDTTRTIVEYVFTNPLCIAWMNVHVKMCQTIPALSQGIKWSIDEYTCTDNVKPGVTDVTYEDIHEESLECLHTGYEICIDPNEQIKMLARNGIKITYIKTDESRPLNDTTFKVITP